MRADIGLWRSTLGDTHPHVGIEIARDYWPQATHLVWEAPLLVTCASCTGGTGPGGGSQQAMFKRDLDPVLAGALDRWQQAPFETAIAAVVRWFDEIQAGFDTLGEPARADQFQAGAIGLLAHDDSAAIVQTGLERGWRWRDGVLEQVTTDHTFAGSDVLAGGDELLHEMPASWFRKGTPDHRRRWHVQPVDIRAGDVFVLASGVHATTLETDYVSDAVADTLATRPRVAGAQDVADRLGKLAERVADYSNPGSDVDWTVRSRLSIAVVWI